MCFAIDHRPAKSSRGAYQQWLGINNGSTWTHSEQPFNFTNWEESALRKNDRATVLWYMNWKWENTWMVFEKAAFMCEKNM